jgi:hypothetical protein
MITTEAMVTDVVDEGGAAVECLIWAAWAVWVVWVAWAV